MQVDDDEAFLLDGLDTSLGGNSLSTAYDAMPRPAIRRSTPRDRLPRFQAWAG